MIESGPFKRLIVPLMRPLLITSHSTHSKPGGAVTEIYWSVYQILFSRPNMKEKSVLANETKKDSEG